MAYPDVDTLVDGSSVTELSDLSDDERDEVRTMAILAVESFCNQSFDEEIATERTVDGSGSRRLILPKRLSSLDTLTVYGGSLVATEVALTEKRDQLIVSPDAFPGNWYSQAIRDDRKPVFPLGSNTVTIEGTWGWADDEFPNPVAIAIRKDMEEQAYALTNPISTTTRAFTKLGMTSISEGPLDVRLDRQHIGMSRQVAMLLEPYVWHPTPALA